MHTTPDEPFEQRESKRNLPEGVSRDVKAGGGIEALCREIARRRLDVTVAEENGVVLLSGRVPSHHLRAEMDHLAKTTLPDDRVQNLLDVETQLPDALQDYAGEDLADSERPESVTGIVDPADTFNPEFSGQPLETNALDAEDSGVEDQDPVEPDPVFYPATDPVIVSDRTGSVDVLGGFSPGADDAIEVAPSAEDALPGDEALADAIRQELLEDATTTDLTVHVSVTNGNVTLRGTVASLEDAENAEDVAGRVPGVQSVNEELKVEGM